MAPNDPLTEQLRLLCRDEVHLIEQHTALVIQLEVTLKEYYPAAIEAFDQCLDLLVAVVDLGLQDAEHFGQADGQEQRTTTHRQFTHQAPRPRPR
ncbi:MAG: hypothetical protein AB9869_20740 [Verrucomicrobiia bacterium]